MTWRHRMAMALVRAAQGQTFTDFMTAMEGKKVKNPDTDRMVLYKSLKGPKGQELLKREFEKWKGESKTDEEETESPTGPKEGTPAKTTTESRPFKPISLKSEADRMDYGRSWNKIREKWKPTHIKALNVYTGPEYKEINRSLRGGDLPMQYINTVSSMDNLFRSSAGKVPKDVVVFRRVGSQHPLVNLLKKKELKEGYTFEDLGFVSTTLDPGWFGFEDDADSDDKTEYLLHMDLPKGSPGVYVGLPPEKYSENSHEMEMILARGTKVEVTKIDGPNIYCRVVAK